MATPNYSYEKRQRELAKKRKTEEKRNRKSNPGHSDGHATNDPSAPAEGGPPPQAGTGESVNAG
ncbi:hypothetical protein [uncultured Sphaerotilus sp.]|uniref:hypothetical protein n=1 Tax=uncultured Sphaerotilus sp. TaxID=474984 RepID=UPI0030CA23BD